MTSELDPQARALIGLALKGEQRLPRSRERVRRGVLTALAAPAALGASEAAAASKAAGVAGGAATTGTKALISAVRRGSRSLRSSRLVLPPPWSD